MGGLAPGAGAEALCADDDARELPFAAVLAAAVLAAAVLAAGRCSAGGGWAGAEPGAVNTRLTFKLLSDTEKKVVAEYGSLNERGMATRNTFLIDPKGKIVKVWTGVKPSEHSDEILAALGDLQKQ